MKKLCECRCGRLAPISPRTDRFYGWVKGKPKRFIAGHNLSNMAAKKHGMSASPEYRSYMHAKGRCTNPKDLKWPDYGGRGIKFRFKSFEQFFVHIGPRPEGTSLDRIEVDGHYEPGNVKWSTPLEQTHNRRCSSERESWELNNVPF